VKFLFSVSQNYVEVDDAIIVVLSVGSPLVADQAEAYKSDLMKPSSSFSMGF
jgi:hypothetical protein